MLLKCFVRRMIHTQVRVSVRRRASPERQKADRTGFRVPLIRAESEKQPPGFFAASRSGRTD